LSEEQGATFPIVKISEIETTEKKLVEEGRDSTHSFLKRNKKNPACP
jgi:hypothetical protein